MKRYEMIKNKNYFNSIIKNGKYIKDKYFVIYYIYNDNSDHFAQFGIAIKNSIGKAVVRNKLKRRCRSLIEQNKNLFKKEYDYIIMIREGFKDSKYNCLNESLVNLLKGL